MEILIMKGFTLNYVKLWSPGLFSEKWERSGEQFATQTVLWNGYRSSSQQQTLRGISSPVIRERFPSD
jgi:hypothetical protein